MPSQQRLPTRSAFPAAGRPTHEPLSAAKTKDRLGALSQSVKCGKPHQESAGLCRQKHEPSRLNRRQTNQARGDILIAEGRTESCLSLEQLRQLMGRQREPRPLQVQFPRQPGKNLTDLLLLLVRQQEIRFVVKDRVFRDHRRHPGLRQRALSAPNSSQPSSSPINPISPLRPHGFPFSTGLGPSGVTAPSVSCSVFFFFSTGPDGVPSVGDGAPDKVGAVFTPSTPVGRAKALLAEGAPETESPITVTGTAGAVFIVAWLGAATFTVTARETDRKVVETSFTTCGFCEIGTVVEGWLGNVSVPSRTKVPPV